MYERDDLNIVNIGTSHRPYAQYTPAVVEPAGERRPEWWIAHRLLQELGLASLLDEDDPDPWGKWRHLLSRGSDIDLDVLRASGEVVMVDPPRPGSFYDSQVRTGDGLVDCCPAAFTEAIERCHTFFADAHADATAAVVGDRPLLLIHKRDPWMHNTWMANLERMKTRGRTTNPLGVHPADARAIGVTDGDEVRITSAHGEVVATVDIDDDLMVGVVSMVHGWGHQVSPRLRVAHRDPGVNPNALLPSGPGAFEPLSSQAHMTGIAVSVTACV